MTVTLYKVGGCVRDELLGVTSKDIDYTVVLDEGAVTSRRTKSGKLIPRTPFQVMDDELVRRGFEIFLRTPQYLTIRARFPKADGHPALIKHGPRLVTADFVLARKDGEYADGRRPDSVEPGTLLDDLKRRDFTVNAIAKAEDGTLIDPFGGQEDLKAGVLRCVGSAEDRLREDALRALRALRFAVTKGFTLDDELWVAMRSEWLPELVAKVSAERRQAELTRAFKHDTVETLGCLGQLPRSLQEAVFSGGLWLEGSLKG